MKVLHQQYSGNGISGDKRNVLNTTSLHQCLESISESGLCNQHSSFICPSKLFFTESTLSVREHKNRSEVEKSYSL